MLSVVGVDDRVLEGACAESASASGTVSWLRLVYPLTRHRYVWP